MHIFQVLLVLFLSQFSDINSFLMRCRPINRHITTTYMAAGEFDWKVTRKGAEDAMKKSIDALGSQFNTLRAGAANPSILDRVFVDSYGSLTPLPQVARIGTSGSQQLVIEPFDKALLKEIEKAISQSSLNLTPTNDGSGTIRINVWILQRFITQYCVFLMSLTYRYQL